MKPLRVLVFSATLLLTLQPILAVDSPSNSSDDSEFIRTSCDATLYPDVCLASLSAFSGSLQKDPARLARAAISVTLNKARDLASYLANITRPADDSRAAAVLRDCFENLKDAAEEMKGSMRQMRELETWTGSVESFRFQMSNVQTWLSAALTDEDTCSDAFEDVADDPDKVDVCGRVDDVKKLTSNALALVNHYADKATH
ncbi:PREDICTED: 21 kDa protein [Tarenaya hassleriana]|uniref:21 kDa protein n=1 Tax=Tarenaya hassleriana TaxID=28532 RepID=UPI00053C3C5D|nr:PREDICTED: 21 kDa protein [Tarenaya hassleriana]